MPSESTRHIAILSRLVLSPMYEKADTDPGSEDLPDNEALRAVVALTPEELPELLALANTNHVVVRALTALRRLMAISRNHEMQQWASDAIEAEQARINRALSFLQSICNTLEAKGCDLTVIKSLDHWPDLGSDLDLYSGADSDDVIHVMTRNFQARLAPRSWGDRLAGKWNFIVPGLPELVEVHVGRLGQTGEQRELARRVSSRAQRVQIGGYNFRVPAPEERLMISTLQRMYRHFYMRLCDVVDNAQLVETQSLDYAELRAAAEEAGIWQGVATYLSLISDYVERYRGQGLALPPEVAASTQFGGNAVSFRRGFLRIPIMPESAKLYISELKSLLFSCQVRGTLRLSLLPCLATAAALELRITGSDKGIW